MVLLLDTSKETERSIANYFPSKLKAVLDKLCIHTPPVDLCIFSIRFDLEARYVRSGGNVQIFYPPFHLLFFPQGPRPLKKSTAVSMQEPLKEASPDWIGDDLIHNFAGGARVRYPMAALIRRRVASNRVCCHRSILHRHDRQLRARRYVW